jgi:hypothetical protein
LFCSSAGTFAGTYHHLLWVVHGVNGALLAGLVDAKDGADRDAGINVGGAVKWVKHNNVVACKIQRIQRLE